jgi:hypothetical protein
MTAVRLRHVRGGMRPLTAFLVEKMRQGAKFRKNRDSRDIAAGHFLVV